MRFGPALGFILLIIVAIGLAKFASQQHPGDTDTVPVSERPDPSAADAKPKPTATPANTRPVNTITLEQAQQGAVTVVMDVEGRGQVTMQLFPKAAPKTVEHFLKLVKQGFYNGILFHRVVSGFVAQAGDPKSKQYKPEDLPDADAAQAKGLGSGGSGENVPFEPNSLTNEPGTIAMALNSPQSDTGDSQFFINLVSNTQLNGDYCVFGKVTSMDVVNQIKQGDRIKSMTVKP
jgi:peptidyl-prolyl cis-trans isomerase B (cyclophilin B)